MKELDIKEFKQRYKLYETRGVIRPSLAIGYEWFYLELDGRLIKYNTVMIGLFSITIEREYLKK